MDQDAGSGEPSPGGAPEPSVSHKPVDQRAGRGESGPGDAPESSGGAQPGGRGAGRDEPGPGAARYGAAIALVVLLYISLRFLSVAVHEVLGHGLSAEMAGGTFFAVYASPAGGYASLYVPGADSGTLAIVLLSGIGVTIFFGLFALLLSRAIPGGFAKVALLLLAETSLMSSALYLAFGGLRADGDPYVATYLLGLDRNALAPVGIFLALIFSVVMSREFVKVELLGDRKPLARALLLWTPGLSFGAIALAGFLLRPENQYAGLYGATYLFAGLGSSYVATIGTAVTLGKPALGGWRQALVVVVCLCVSMYAWVGVFGPTSAEARGVLLREPPSEVEASYFDQLIGNARLDFSANRTVLVTLVVRPMMVNGSALDKRIHDAFDTRPYLPYYETMAETFVAQMLNLSANESAALNATAALDGSVEAMGTTYGNGRSAVVLVPLNLSGEYRVRITDPWKPGGYLDRMEITWTGGVALAGYAQDGGKAPAVGPDSLVWLNENVADAPTNVTVTFSP